MRIISVILLIIIAAVASSFAISFHGNGKNYLPTFFSDSLEADRLKYMNLVMESIKGKEKLPADEVFKNLKVIKGKSNISAEHLLWMMNWGWSAELGVSCSYCHSVNNWESDTLKAKDIARGMWKLRVKINEEILPGITGKDYQKEPAVSCITCATGENQYRMPNKSTSCFHGPDFFRPGSF